MKIGITVGAGTDKDGSLQGLIALGQKAESMGFDSLWMANIFGYDAITALTLMGYATDRIEVGTAVVPSYPRHPAALAQQAMTAAAATDGRFVLGLGLSHKMVIEDMFGLCYDKPAKHMREYLQVLMPLLAGEAVDFAGELYRVRCRVDIPLSNPVPTIVAALGPLMLKIAGALSDGTITWMTGLKTLEEHIIPSINSAAKDAGKGPARVVAGLPIVLTNDIDGARAKINKALEIYGQLPSYRAMLDKEGAEGPADVALLGDETALRKQLAQMRDIGVTDFNAAIMQVDSDSYERTVAFLQTELS